MKIKEASDEFMRAVVGSGSPVITCQFCGREHFAPSADGFDEGELEELIRKQQKEPDKYFADGSVTDILWGVLDGKQIVWGCPCNSGRKYEDFILRHRYVIADFLQALSTKQEETAAENKKTAGRVHEAVYGT